MARHGCRCPTQQFVPEGHHAASPWALPTASGGSGDGAEPGQAGGQREPCSELENARPMTPVPFLQTTADLSHLLLSVRVPPSAARVWHFHFP